MEFDINSAKILEDNEPQFDINSATDADETEIIYDQEQDKTIEAPVGLKPKEITYLDAVQNKKEKPSSMLGGVMNDVSRFLSSTNPKDLTPTGTRKPDQQEDLFATPREFGKGANITALSIKRGGADFLTQVSDFSKLAEGNKDWQEIDSALLSIGIDSKLANLQEEFINELKVTGEEESSALGELITKRQAEVTQPSTAMAGGAAASIIPSILWLAGTKNASGLATLWGATESGAMYRELKEGGLSTGDAQKKSSAYGIIIGAINLIGGEKIINYLAKDKALLSYLGTSAVSGAQEGAETTANIAVKTRAGLDERSLQEKLSDVLRDTLFGTIFGAASRGILDVPKLLREPVASAELEQIKEKLAERPELITNAIKEMVETELSPVAVDDLRSELKDTAKVIKAIDEDLPMDKIIEQVNSGVGIDEAIKITRETKRLSDEQQKIISDLEAEAQVISQREADLMQPEIKDTDPEVIKARINKLDSDLAILDDRINAQQDIVSERFKAGKSTKAVENKLDKLLTQRETMATELAGLETADRRLVAKTPEGKGISEQAVVAAESLDKDVTIKGKEIRESARKMAIAKIKNLAKGIRSGKSLAKQEMAAVQKAVVNYINDYIKNNPALSEIDKARFLPAIRQTQTFEQFQRNIKTIESMLAQAERKAKLNNEIARLEQQITSIRTYKSNKKLFGKYNPELQNTFNRFNDYLKLKDKIFAENKLETLTQKVQELSKDDPIYSKAVEDLEAARVQFKKDVSKGNFLQDRLEAIATKLDEMSIDDVAYHDALLDIHLLDTLIKGNKVSFEQVNSLNNILSDMINEGRNIALQRKEEQKKLKEIYVNKFVDNVKTRYPDAKTTVAKAIEWFDQSTAIESTKSITKYLGYTWMSKADFLRGRGKPDKVVDDVLNVIPESAKKTKMVSEINKKLDAALRELFALKITRTDNFLLGQGLERVKLQPYVDAKGELVSSDKELTFTKAELMDLYMLFQRDDARFALMHKDGNAYTSEFENSVTAALSKEEKDLAALYQDYYDQEIYPQVNPVYRKLNYIDLPKDSKGKYTPIRRKLDGDDAQYDLMGDFGIGNFFAGISPSFLKENKRSTKALKIENAHTKFQRHLHEAAGYVAYAEKIRLLNSTIFSKEVRASLEKQVGKDETIRLLDNLRLSLRNIAGNDYVHTLDNHMNVLWSAAGNAVASTTVALKPFSALMQLSAHNLYSVDVNKISYVKGVAIAATNPKKAWETLKQHPVFADRFADWEGRFEGIVPKKRPAIAAFRNKPALRRFLYVPIRAADFAVVLNGAYARYHAQVKSGMSHEAALNEVARWTEETQQPRTRAATPDIFKGFFSQASRFMSGPVAGFNVGVNAIRDYRLNRISEKQMIDRVVNSIISVSIIPTLISTFFSNDDDEEFGDKVLSSSVTSLVGSYPVIGGMMMYAADKLFADGYFDAYEPRMIDPAKTFVDFINGLNKWQDIDEEALTHYDNDAYKTAKSIGMVLKLPLNNLYAEWIGLQEVMRDDPNGFIRVLGRTQSQIVGQKEAQKQNRQKQKEKTRMELIENN